MNERELKAYLDVAGDFNFIYKGVWYYISGLSDGSYSCGVVDSDKDVVFSSLGDVLGGFKIDGMPLQEILPCIDW